MLMAFDKDSEAVVIKINISRFWLVQEPCMILAHLLCRKQNFTYDGWRCGMVRDSAALL